MAQHNTCETCRFWAPPSPRFPHGLGACHRRAPAVRLVPIDGDGVLTERRDAEAIWAETDADDWCGEHQHLVPLAEAVDG